MILCKIYFCLIPGLQNSTPLTHIWKQMNHPLVQHTGSSITDLECILSMFLYNATLKSILVLPSQLSPIFFKFLDDYFICIYRIVMYSTWSIELIYVYLFTMIISGEDYKEQHSYRFCYSLCLSTKCLLSTLFINTSINVVYYSGGPISTPIL